jgi:hypothetical protein
MIYAFTSAALNYLPKARLCLGSLRKHHPELTLVYALADRLPPGIKLADACVDQVIAVDDLPIPDRQGWIFQHSIVELSTGIKPFVLRELLRRPDCEAAFYFDPDIVVFSRLDDLIAELGTSDILLTPHQTVPETSFEAIVDNEICSMKHGIYNLGFIGVRKSEAGLAFADWWAERVRLFCQERCDLGIFTDQKWIDHVPSFFDGVRILKNPRFNVATWNLTTRKLHGASLSNLKVFEEPLGFYHFTGFDSGAHRIMAVKNARDNDTVHMLVEWYKNAAAATSADRLAQVPWHFGRYTNGVPIRRAHRDLYRNRIDLQQAFPDPFDARKRPWRGGVSSFFCWVTQHEAGTAA